LHAPESADGPRAARPEGKDKPDVLLNLGLENAAAVGGWKLTTLRGGVPIIIDGQVVGAIGVGGGAGEQDTEVAKAGIKALLDALKR
jgi:glc operon protein GlcG